MADPNPWEQLPEWQEVVDWWDEVRKFVTSTVPQAADAIEKMFPIG